MLPARPLLVHPYPTPGLYQRLLDRHVRVLQPLEQDPVLGVSEPVVRVCLGPPQFGGLLHEVVEDVLGDILGDVLGVSWSHLRQPNPLPQNRPIGPGHTLVRACLSTRPARASPSPSPRGARSVCPRLRRGCSGARTPAPRALLLEFVPALAHSPAENPPPPRPLYTLLGTCGIGVGLCPIVLLLNRLGRFSGLWGRFLRGWVQRLHSLGHVEEDGVFAFQLTA